MEKEVAKCLINVSDVANIVMAIASIVNLFVVIWIFFKERNDANKKNKKDKKDVWYDSLGLKEITISFSNQINELKNKSIEFLDDKIDQEQYVKLYKQVDEDFLKYKNEYLTIIDCIDENLTSKLTEEFQQIQDDLYKIVSLMLGDKNLNSNCNTQEIIIEFDKVRKKIIKMSVNINN